MPSQEEGSSGWWGKGALAYPVIVDKHELAFFDANIPFSI